MNFPAIDLGDKLQKICFQITADASGSKLKDTIAKFERYNLALHYSRLVLLVISPSEPPRVPNTIDGVNVESWSLKHLARDVARLDIQALEYIEQIFAKGLVSSIVNNESILSGFNISASQVGQCNAFIQSLGYKYDEEEMSQIRADLQTLSGRLALLARKEREFLYMALALGSQPMNNWGYPKENAFYVPCATLDSRVDDALPLFKALEHRGLMAYVEDHQPYGAVQAVESLSVHFGGNFETNYFLCIKNFSSDLMLRQIILNNDFSCLD